MFATLNYNINPVLIEAGYEWGGDNGYFRIFTSKDIKRYNIRRNFHLRCADNPNEMRENQARATKNWRFHAIAVSDFSFDLHIDCGRIYGHAYIKEHSIIDNEISRIKQV